MNWSIVLIHNGHQKYLRYNLDLLSRLIPDSDIFLAGNDSNKEIAEEFGQCIWVSIDTLVAADTSYEAFVQNYKHFSINHLRYERFCFERWFILLNLAKHYRLQNFLYLDTDNFLLTPPAVLLDEYPDFHYGQTIDPGAPEFLFFSK
ncbi:MAG: hypothetical protein AAGJ81_01040 [Verrucomicrobiota bacterium]